MGVGDAIEQQLLCESGIHDLLQRVSELVDDRLEIGILEVLQKVNDGFEDVDLGEQKRLAESIHNLMDCTAKIQAFTARCVPTPQSSGRV